MDFKELKNKNYYIRIQKGVFNNKKHIEYSLVKDISDTQKKIACLLNLKSVKILVNKYKFSKFEDKHITNWCQMPNSLGLNNDKPLVISWN